MLNNRFWVMLCVLFLVFNFLLVANNNKLIKLKNSLELKKPMPLIHSPQVPEPVVEPVLIHSLPPSRHKLFDQSELRSRLALLGIRELLINKEASGVYLIRFELPFTVLMGSLTTFDEVLFSLSPQQMTFSSCLEHEDIAVVKILAERLEI